MSRIAHEFERVCKLHNVDSQIKYFRLLRENRVDLDLDCISTLCLGFFGSVLCRLELYESTKVSRVQWSSTNTVVRSMVCGSEAADEQAVARKTDSHAGLCGTDNRFVAVCLRQGFNYDRISCRERLGDILGVGALSVVKDEGDVFGKEIAVQSRPMSPASIRTHASKVALYQQRTLKILLEGVQCCLSKSRTCVRRVQLSGLPLMNVEQTSMRVLHAVSRCTSLQFLDLSHSHLSSKLFASLTNTFGAIGAGLANLVDVRLRDCGLKDDCNRTLQSLIMTSNTHQSSACWSNSLRAPVVRWESSGASPTFRPSRLARPTSSVVAGATGAIACGLKHLDISHNFLSDRMISALLAALSNNRTVQTVDMSYNQVTSSGLIALLRARDTLESSALRSVDLSHNLCERVDLVNIVSYLNDTIDTMSSPEVNMQTIRARAEQSQSSTINRGDKDQSRLVSHDDSRPSGESVQDKHASDKGRLHVVRRHHPSKADDDEQSAEDGAQSIHLFGTSFGCVLAAPQQILLRRQTSARGASKIIIRKPVATKRKEGKAKLARTVVANARAHSAKADMKQNEEIDNTSMDTSSNLFLHARTDDVPSHRARGNSNHRSNRTAVQCAASDDDNTEVHVHAVITAPPPEEEQQRELAHHEISLPRKDCASEYTASTADAAGTHSPIIGKPSENEIYSAAAAQGGHPSIVSASSGCLHSDTHTDALSNTVHIATTSALSALHAALHETRTAAPGSIALQESTLATTAAAVMPRSHCCRCTGNNGNRCSVPSQNTVCVTALLCPPMSTLPVHHVAWHSATHCALPPAAGSDSTAHANVGVTAHGVAGQSNTEEVQALPEKLGEPVRSQPVVASTEYSREVASPGEAGHTVGDAATTGEGAMIEPLLDEPPDDETNVVPMMQNSSHHPPHCSASCSESEGAKIAEQRFIAALIDRVESAESEMTHRMEEHFQQTRQQMNAIREEMVSKLRNMTAECEASTDKVEERCASAVNVLMNEMGCCQRVAPEGDMQIQLSNLIQQGMLCVKDQIVNWRHASGVCANEAVSEQIVAQDATKRHRSNTPRSNVNARLFLHETNARLKDLGW